jgi:hypothetical protein
MKVNCIDDFCRYINIAPFSTELMTMCHNVLHVIWGKGNEWATGVEQVVMKHLFMEYNGDYIDLPDDQTHPERQHLRGCVGKITVERKNRTLNQKVKRALEQVHQVSVLKRKNALGKNFATVERAPWFDGYWAKSKKHPDILAEQKQLSAALTMVTIKEKINVNVRKWVEGVLAKGEFNTPEQLVGAMTKSLEQPPSSSLPSFPFPVEASVTAHGTCNSPITDSGASSLSNGGGSGSDGSGNDNDSDRSGSGNDSDRLGSGNDNDSDQSGNKDSDSSDQSGNGNNNKVSDQF